MFAEFLSFIIGKIVFFCASIGGDSFPKPLAKEEERRCLIAFKNGDMQAKEKLIKHNLRLVAHIVKKYQGAYDNEDLISVGTMGLVKAINSYDELYHYLISNVNKSDIVLILGAGDIENFCRRIVWVKFFN